MECIRTCLETELARFRHFCTDHLAEYTFPPAEIAPLQDYANRLRTILGRDIGIPIETFAKQVLIPHWKSIFDADNYIDSCGSIHAQRALLDEIIHSIRSNGVIPPHVAGADHLQIELMDDPFKRAILLEELSAEQRLTDASRPWQDACEDRIRVMYYSVLLALDISACQRWLAKVRSVLYEGQMDCFEPVCSAKEVGEILAMCPYMPTHTPTWIDCLAYLAWISIGVSVTDDCMDVEEDQLHEKCTGITQAIREGISLSTIQSTCTAYLESTAMDPIHQWFVQCMLFAHQDEPTCMNVCREGSPYLFHVFFQRK